MKRDQTKKQSKSKRKLAPQLVKMRTWTLKNGDPADLDRLDGCDDFELAIAGNSAEIELCSNDLDHARRRFSQWGHFYLDGEDPDPTWGFPPYDPAGDRRPIPKDVEIHVYGWRKHRREPDKQVVLVIDDGSLNSEPTDDIWRCTYTPYESRVWKPRYSKAKKH